MGGNIPGGNFLGGNFLGGSLISGNFPSGSSRKQILSQPGCTFQLHFQNLTSFFHRIFFSIYRGILELKRDSSILRKNDLFANNTCCGLTAKPTTQTDKQINKNQQYRFFVQTVVNRQTREYFRKCLQFWKWNP